MRHDQLLPILPGEERGAYVKRMRSEFSQDVPLMELMTAATGRWIVEDRARKKQEILHELDEADRHLAAPWALAAVIRRIVTEPL